MSISATQSKDLAVRAVGVSKVFGDVVALDNLDLTIPTGTVHGIVGPNGAGKTTFLSLVLGLAAVTGGELDVLGERATRILSVPAGVQGFVDAPGLYPMFTARRNLQELSRLQGIDEPGRIDESLESVGLADVADDKVRGFSLGMRQRLGLAAALITRPQLLVMDEPSNGLDPAGRVHVHRVLADLASQGRTVILSSHRMDDLSQLCDQVTLLSHGRSVFQGTVGELATLSPNVDHRVVTSDTGRALAIAQQIDGLGIGDGHKSDAEHLVVRGGQAERDALVHRLAAEGVVLRELTPVMSPLEAAFLSLTGDASLMDNLTDSSEETLS